MISKRECKYRNKIIAENHLKKDGQKYLDQYVNDKLLTYKKIYFDYGLLYTMLHKYSISKLNDVMKYVGTSCTQAANSFQKFAVALESVQ